MYFQSPKLFFVVSEVAAYLCLLYILFWVIPRRLNFIFRRFGTLCLFHLHRQVDKLFTYLPMKMDQTECSETSAYKIQTPGNYPEENIQRTEHRESLKSRIFVPNFLFYVNQWHNLLESNHLEDIGLHGRIILKWILKEVSAWTGRIWLKTGKNGGLFYVWQWNFCFYKMLGISCLAEELGYSRKTLLHGVC